MESTAELGISDVISIIARRKEQFISLTIIVIAIAALASFVIPPIYKAQTKLIVQNEANLYPSGVLPAISDDKAFLSSQIEIMTSRVIVEKALSDVQGQGMLKGMSFYDIKDKITVGYLNESHVLQIGVSLQNQKEAVELANAIVSNYVSYSSNSKKSILDNNLASLSKNIAALSSNMDGIQSRLKQLSGKDKLDFYKAQVPLYVNYMIDLDKNNRENKNNYLRLDSELAKTSTVLKSGDPMYHYPLLPSMSGKDNGESPTTSLTTIPWIQDIRNKIQAAESNLSRLSAEYTDKNPEVIGVKDEISLLKSKLEDELERVMIVYTGYYKDYLEYLKYQEYSNDDQKAGYKEDLGRVSAHIEEASGLEIEYSILSKSYEISRDIYSILLRKESDLQLVRDKFMNAGLPNIQVLERAAMPLRKVSPNLPLNLFLGAFFGIFLGACSAVASEKKSNSQERRDMPRVKGVYVVGYEFKSDKVSEKQFSIIENVSGSGIAIRTRDRFKLGVELFLEIRFSENEVVSASAKVVCVNLSEVQGMYSVGLKFTKISLQEQEKLLNYLYAKKGQN